MTDSISAQAASDVHQLADLLRARGWKMCTAESCTGGMIAAACIDLAGSSNWFDRGWVTYSNTAKIEELAVPQRDIRTDGAVSEVVARAMAMGAAQRARHSWRSPSPVWPAPVAAVPTSRWEPFGLPGRWAMRCTPSACALTAIEPPCAKPPWCTPCGWPANASCAPERAPASPIRQSTNPPIHQSTNPPIHQSAHPAACSP